MQLRDGSCWADFADSTALSHPAQNESTHIFGDDENRSSFKNTVFWKLDEGEVSKPSNPNCNTRVIYFVVTPKQTNEQMVA